MDKGNGNGAIVIGTIDRFQKPGWREDYVLRVIPPSKRSPEPKVELRIWVDNKTTSPPFQGLSTRGGYLSMPIETFNEMIDLAPKIREAVKALTPEEGEEPAADTVPGAPSFDLLTGNR